MNRAAASAVANTPRKPERTSGAKPAIASAINASRGRAVADSVGQGRSSRPEIATMRAPSQR